MEIKSFLLGELSSRIGAELKGDPDCLISSPAPLDVAGSGQITFLRDAKYKKLFATTQASAVIINPKNVEETKTNLLVMEDPYLGFIKVVNLMMVASKPIPGIHESAVIGRNCDISKTANIAANVVIGDNVRIGEYSLISANTTIGNGVSIADNVCIYANVTLYEMVRIGARTIIHSGAVIGADGFGMLNDNGKWVKVPQVGSVVIGEDVEIGANTTIDRGALGDTEIGNGVKLDNQIQIAHNVKIDDHSLIAAGSSVAGSVKIGKHCMFGGAVNISGHLEIVDQVILTGTTSVGASITEPGVYSSGMLPLPNRQWRKNAICLSRLSGMERRLKNLEKNIS